MNEDLKKELKVIGISSSILVIIVLVGICFYAYKSILEAENLRLSNRIMKKELSQ